MSLSIKEKIDKIAEVYPGWRLKLQSMPPAQICAIYSSMNAKGQFNKKKLTLKPKKEKFVQLTIYDLFGDLIK